MCTYQAVEKPLPRNVDCLPANTLFMIQDKKNLRPDIAGGVPGRFGFASEVCRLDAVIPGRHHSQDFESI
jgi:hypothetical protein